MIIPSPKNNTLLFLSGRSSGQKAGLQHLSQNILNACACHSGVLIENVVNLI